MADRYYVGSPGIGGAIKDAIASVVGGHATQPKHQGTPDDDVVRHAETGEDDDGSHSSYIPSNAGQQAQSSDHWNRY